MSYAPFEHLESLCIGTVDYVAPDEIRVLLDTEAPETIALNAGDPRPFPRVNGYVLIPVDTSYLVGQIEWLTVERSPFPQRQGMRDFGLIDLPYPLRRMKLNPLGMLTAQSTPDGAAAFSFRRGADALPSIGTSVLLPTSVQLRSIIESGEKRHVKIGTSPLAGNADVCVDPDRLFGRHLAVLGNTGSGKSCSVAGLVRWSLEEARRKGGCEPNSRFIILDPNGEYKSAFTGENARFFTAKVEENGDQLLKVPIWFWNSSEWCSFIEASSKTQRPTLIQALRTVKSDLVEPEENQSHEMRRFLRTLVQILRIEKNKGNPWAGFPKSKGFYELLEKWNSSLEDGRASLETQESDKLEEICDELEDLCRPRRKQYATYDFTLQEIGHLIELASNAHSLFGGSIEELELLDADIPRYFSGDSLLRSVEATAEILNVSEHVETLLIRLRTLLGNSNIKTILGDKETTLDTWLTDYIGSERNLNGCICIVDLSLVPNEVIQIITAVIARMVLEALQRYRKMNKEVLPTVLVMEEAHTFIKKYPQDSENVTSATICCQIFEKIAREGRKFGLGLVLSSQRPSELSPTVLSQCNTFLLHRISNDRDQELVQRLVPDNLRGLLRELPSLPSQNAILLGWATELPILVRMNDLPENQRPHSSDPDFWKVWTGESERSVDWEKIADDWQGGNPEGDAEDSSPD